MESGTSTPRTTQRDNYTSERIEEGKGEGIHIFDTDSNNMRRSKRSDAERNDREQKENIQNETRDKMLADLEEMVNLDEESNQNKVQPEDEEEKSPGSSDLRMNSNRSQTSDQDRPPLHYLTQLRCSQGVRFDIGNDLPIQTVKDKIDEIVTRHGLGKENILIFPDWKTLIKIFNEEENSSPLLGPDVIEKLQNSDNKVIKELYKKFYEDIFTKNSSDLEIGAKIQEEEVGECILHTRDDAKLPDYIFSSSFLSFKNDRDEWQIRTWRYDCVWHKNNRKYLVFEAVRDNEQKMSRRVQIFRLIQEREDESEDKSEDESENEERKKIEFPKYKPAFAFTIKLKILKKFLEILPEDTHIDPSFLLKIIDYREENGKLWSLTTGNEIDRELLCEGKTADRSLHFCHEVALDILTKLIKNRVKYDEKNEIEKALLRSLCYSYQQIQKHFDGKYSSKLFPDTSKFSCYKTLISYPKSKYQFDMLQILKTYRLYREVSEYKPQKNSLQNFFKSNDHVLVPTYLSGIKDMYYKVKDCCKKPKTLVCRDHTVLKFDYWNRCTNMNKEKVIGFFDLYSSHIEIKNEQGKREVVYFWIPDECDYLTQNMKDEVWIRSNKASAQSFLMDFSQEMKMKIGHLIMKKTLNDFILTGIFSRNRYRFERLIEHIMIMINILLIIGIYQGEGGINIFGIGQSQSTSLLISFGWVLVFLATGTLLSNFETRTTTAQLMDFLRGLCKFSLKMYVCLLVFLLLMVVCSEILMIEVHPLFFIPSYILGYIIGNRCCLYIHILTSVLMGSFWNEYFFALLIIPIILKIKSTAKVIKTIWIGKWLLLSTMFLILCVFYLFALIGHAFLKDDYGNNLEDSCDDAITCFATIFDSWYMFDGALGGFLHENAPSISVSHGYRISYWKVFHNIAFYFLICVLLVEIFSGILTDTFAQIRNKEEVLDAERSSRCFACGLEPHDFKDFSYHTKYRHNIWDYLIFCYIKMVYRDGYRYLCSGEECNIYGKSYWTLLEWMPVAFPRETSMDRQIKDLSQKVDKIEKTILNELTIKNQTIESQLNAQNEKLAKIEEMIMKLANSSDLNQPNQESM